MSGDGRLHPCTDKAQPTHQLERLVALPGTTYNQVSQSVTAQIIDQTCILTKIQVHICYI